MKTIINGIKYENPTFVLLLGLCSALAVTNKFETAYIMGICVLIVLVISNFLVSLTRKLVSDSIRIPFYVMLIVTLVTCTEMLLKHFIPVLYETLGIYLPLIVVNCIVLGRNLSVASKNNVKTSVLDGIGIGLGYTLALMLIALVREVLGNNTITLMDEVSKITHYKAIYKVFPNSEVFPIKFFVTPAGSFLTLGFLIAFLKGKKYESN